MSVPFRTAILALSLLAAMSLPGGPALAQSDEPAPVVIVGNASFTPLFERVTLAPGESFTYTSGCPLKTSSGFMVGAYQMQLMSGEFINVEIPAFSLDSPHEKHAIN